MAETMIVDVGKADPAIADQPVPDARIEISNPMPMFWTLGEIADYYDEQARQIEEALHQSLPGGTYDRLLGRMLGRKASHFRLSYS